MGKLPFRIWIGVMIFCTTALNYANRVYFQVAFIAILDRSYVVFENGTDTVITEPDYGPRFNYTSYQEGLIIGAYFYGQTISSIPGGPISEHFGPWLSILVTFGVNIILTLIGAIWTNDYWIILFLARFFIGVSSGVQYPALQCLIGRWAPPNEKGKFVACLMGNVFGSVLATIITGYLVKYLGWKSSFYGMITVMLIFCLVWFFLVADYPTKSLFCSKEEVEFIMESHAGAIAEKKMMAPFAKIAISIPFIALVIAQFGSLWGLNLIVTSMPKFMADILKFDITQIGVLASLPSLARLITGFIFGAVSDSLIKKEIIKNKAIIRKGFILFSHFLPGLTLFCCTAIGTKPGLAVALLVIMLGFNGAAVATTLVNSHDLAPNFAGTLYGIMNCFGSTPGFIIPTVNAKILEKHNGWSEWTLIFCIGGLIYIITGIFFIIFGSTKLQSWNDKNIETNN